MQCTRDDFVSLPKCELHVHLEGTLTPELYFRFARRNGVTPAFDSVEALEHAYARLSTLKEFLQLYYANMSLLRTEQDFYELALAYAERAATAEGCKHVEVFFDPQAHTKRGVALDACVLGIDRALRAARERWGLSALLIMCIVRDEPVESAQQHLDQVLRTPHLRRCIAALGLDSDEIGYPPSLFAAVFAQAREAGLRVVGHGGHDGPPVPYVSELVDVLHVERIDHGVRCVEDPALTARLRAVPFTVCPVSNVRIGPYAKMRDHPIAQMVRLGLITCLNSDDPAYLGPSYICDVYAAVQREFQYSRQAMAEFARHSFRMSWMADERERQRWTAEIDRWAAQAPFAAAVSPAPAPAPPPR